MTCVVIGGASGMGQALSVKLANENKVVYALDVSATGLEQTKEYNNTINTHIVDVRNLNDLCEFAKNLNNITELYIVAGITCVDFIQGHDMELFRKVMDINFYGAVNSIQAFLPKMSHGRIVFWGSVTCFWYRPTRAAYTCSKKALETLAQTLRLELHDTDISVHFAYLELVKTNLYTTNMHYIRGESSEAQFNKDMNSLYCRNLAMTPEQAVEVILDECNKGIYAIYVGRLSRIFYAWNYIFPINSHKQRVHFANSKFLNAINWICEKLFYVLPS